MQLFHTASLTSFITEQNWSNFLNPVLASHSNHLSLCLRWQMKNTQFWLIDVCLRNILESLRSLLFLPPLSFHTYLQISLFPLLDEIQDAYSHKTSFTSEVKMSNTQCNNQNSIFFESEASFGLTFPYKAQDLPQASFLPPHYSLKARQEKELREMAQFYIADRIASLCRFLPDADFLQWDPHIHRILGNISSVVLCIS